MVPALWWVELVQWDFRQPICWGVGLCPHLFSCLAWGALAPTGFWVGLMSQDSSSSVHRAECSPVRLPPVSVSPEWATASPRLQGVSKTSKVGLAQASIKLLLWPCEIVCVPFKSEVSSPVRLPESSPIGLQRQMLWGIVFPDPPAGESNMGLRTLTPVREPLQYSYSPVCGYGIWLYPKSTHSAAFPVSLVAEDLSGRFQSFSLMVVLQIVVILVCSGEEFRSFYSTIWVTVL